MEALVAIDFTLSQSAQRKRLPLQSQRTSAQIALAGRAGITVLPGESQRQEAQLQVSCDSLNELDKGLKATFGSLELGKVGSCHHR